MTKQDVSARGVTVSGLNACMEIARRRRDDIIRVSLVEDRIRTFSELLKWCASHKRAYHVVTGDDLEKIADTIHHEGICMLVKPKPAATFEALAERLQGDPTRAECIVVMEDVANPHNLGAILRVCAHFGVGTVCLATRKGEKPVSISNAVHRTSEGGVESVDVVHLDDAAAAMRTFKRLGFTLYATSSHARKSAYTTQLPDRVVYMLGSEATGLSRRLTELADAEIGIPGTGHVESLNVACAASILLGEFWRKQSILKAVKARAERKEEKAARGGMERGDSRDPGRRTRGPSGRDETGTTRFARSGKPGGKAKSKAPFKAKPQSKSKGKPKPKT